MRSFGTYKWDVGFCFNEMVLIHPAEKSSGSSRCGAMETNPTRNHEVAGSIPGLTQWVKDLVLLWLWCRPVAIALIPHLAWELPCAVGVALKKIGTKIYCFSKMDNSPLDEMTFELQSERKINFS